MKIEKGQRWIFKGTNTRHVIEIVTPPDGYGAGDCLVIEGSPVGREIPYWASALHSLWTPLVADLRAQNRTTIQSAVDNPDRRVLDGMGRKQGRVWEAYCRGLAEWLELTNNRATPVRITEADVTFYVESALRAAL